MRMRRYTPAFSKVYGADRPHGRAVGGWVIRIHRTRTRCLCACCGEVVKPGEQVAEIEVYDQVVDVCLPCAGTP